jgi:6-phosphogluconate dehydrogenase
MPGGSPEAWQSVAPIFQAIAAKAEDGEPCVTYIGPRGAGHYVKMVHNGIEYADMQLICETYDFLRRGLKLNTSELADIFSDWNSGELQSYLIEITGKILRKIDPQTGLPIVDVILDEAQQKGTGKWTSQNALDVGAPIPSINAAVEMRILSALKDQRVKASRILGDHIPEVENLENIRQGLIEASRDALYASIIISYAQGLGLLHMASDEYEYHLDISEIARIWRAGCIIRAALLNDISSAFKHQPALQNLILDTTFMHAVQDRLPAWRDIIQHAIRLGIPMPGTYASLAYYDAYRSQRLPANLLQAQRDYFGAHTYRRVDQDGIFHTEWVE